MPSEQTLQWDEIEKDALELAQSIKNSGETFTQMLVVARGGFIAGALLGYALDIRTIETVCIRGYDGVEQKNKTAEFVKHSAFDDNASLLIVDDLSDTGRTLSMLKEYYPKAKIATLYVKSEGKSIPDYYVRDFAQECWLHFPWEVDTKPSALRA